MDTKTNETSNETPIWRRPAFWRERAAEWRGPETKQTDSGICDQAYRATLAIGVTPDWWKVYLSIVKFVQQYKPAHIMTREGYFFPLSDRASRAILCERIADDLEKQQTKG